MGIYLVPRETELWGLGGCAHIGGVYKRDRA